MSVEDQPWFVRYILIPVGFVVMCAWLGLGKIIAWFKGYR